MRKRLRKPYIKRIQQLKISLTNQSRQRIEESLSEARAANNLRLAKLLQAILYFDEGRPRDWIAENLSFSQKILRDCVSDFLLGGIDGLNAREADGQQNGRYGPPYKLSPDERETRSQPYQHLLYWLSALGRGTWQSFKKACQTLELEEAKRILRRFKLLGHLESSPDGKRWSIAPTALVQVDSLWWEPEFFLCGQQNEALLEELQNYSTINSIHQPRGDAPPCLRVRLANSMVVERVIEQIKSRLGITIYRADRPAGQLAELLPELEKWRLGLRPLPGVVPSFCDWRRFDGNNGNNFVECDAPNQSGMYEMLRREEGRSTGGRTLFTLFYDAETETWRQGDWYGLRFLALQQSDRPCLARYDAVSNCLAIPYSQRWPELYERALVLASGRLPTYKKNRLSWLVYENIERELGQRLAKKLHVAWEEGDSA